MSNGSAIYFIELHRLGSAVEAAVRAALANNDKRKRKSQVRKIVGLLRFVLGLPNLESSGQPAGIALGVRADGELGLWIIFEPATQIQGDIAP